MDIIVFLTALIATFVTFGLYSVLTGTDNPFYAFAEHSYVGTAIGVLTIVSITFLQKTIDPILKNPGANLLPLLACILGVLMFTRLTPKTAYIARIPMTVAMAISIGVATRTSIFTNIVKMLSSTFLPFWGTDLITNLTNVAIIVFIVAMLFFLNYTTEPKGYTVPVARLGRIILYAGFGVLYAQTFGGRIGLFLGRMETMVFPETQLQMTLVVIATILVIIFLLKTRAPKLMDRLLPSS